MLRETADLLIQEMTPRRLSESYCIEKQQKGLSEQYFDNKQPQDVSMIQILSIKTVTRGLFNRVFQKTYYREHFKPEFDTRMLVTYNKRIRLLSTRPRNLHPKDLLLIAYSTRVTPTLDLRLCH